jgi:tetratricopeptide (TPR) repeat protein
VTELTDQGIAAAVAGDFDSALACFSAITRSNPQDAVALHNHGRVLVDLKRLDEAADYFRRALAAQPHWPEARFNLGVTLNQLGRHQEVLDALESGAPVSPQNYDLHFNRGVALLNLDRFEEALLSCTQALSCRPDDFGALLNRGTALVGLDRDDEGLACFERARALNANHPAAWVNVGVALHALDRPHEAIECVQRALSTDPGNADAWHNLGCALEALDRRQEARTACKAALGIDPHHAAALQQASLADLADGRLLEGFKAYENRWKVLPYRTFKLDTAAPLWLGDAPLAGRRLLVYAEQGLGDTLQFVRYVPLLAAHDGAQVVLRAPAVLLPLLETLPGAVELVAESQPLPAHDFRCPLLSLPLVFGTTLQTIPAQIPYLRADPARAAQWACRLEPRTGRPRIGVVWRGGTVFKRRALRDMRLQNLSPLFELDAQFISLQKEIPEEDRALLGRLPVAQHGESLRDFADTAALVENLDLVIAVDTAVAHLAGALGKPVWIMSRLAGCWRWLRDRGDSPWYPTARLFRQREFKNWESVVQEVVAAGREFVHQWRQSSSPSAAAAVHAGQETPVLPGLHSEGAEALTADEAVALGASLGASGRDHEALLCFERALRIEPLHLRALYNRGAALAHLGLHAPALSAFDKTLQIKPDHAGAMLGRGIASANLERFEEAVACFEWVTARHAEHVEALCGLGFALGKMGRPEEGLRFVDRALSLRPDYADAHYRRGYLLCWLDRLTEALATFEQILAVDPNHQDARCDRSLVLLAQGNYAEGFQQYESRWLTRGASSKPVTEAPLWLGSNSLEGKTILVFAEQGLGDVLQFSRYAALLAHRAAAVILRVPEPLVQLMRSLSGAVRVIGEAEPLPAHDFQCPLLSLPRAFATRLETIPAQVPYLHCAPQAAARWAAALGPKRKPRIGIAWAGRQVAPLTRVRDVPLEALLPLLELDAQFISLQQTVPERDRTLLESLTLGRHGEELRDFADCAGLIENLDLVISVDTAVVHLAGALGKPVWLMNRKASCWRWLRGRDDSPWYPTLRLFRQQQLNDWAGVVAAVKQHAAALLNPHRTLEDYESAGSGTRSAAAPPVSTAAAGMRVRADALMRRAADFLAQGVWTLSLRCLTEVIEHEPLYLAAWDQAARVLAIQGHYPQAADLLQRLVQLDPGHVKAWSRLGSVLALLGRGGEAVACLEKAFQLDPGSPDARCAQGEAHWHHGDAEAALGWFDKALAVDPAHRSARLNRSLVLLSLGKLREGFHAMESRWDCAEARPARRRWMAPQWLGEDLTQGTTILLHAEQGFGDSLQFVRYAPLVAERGARVVLRVPGPLRALMESVAGVAQVASDSDPLPAHDVQCPLLSLPLAFGTEMPTIPAQIPYLKADIARIAQWDVRLGPRRKPRIGLAWAGRQVPPLNHARDLALHRLQPLLEFDADYVSLQQEIPAADLALLAMLPIARHGESMRDFADSAALVENLDLVIAVDTAVVHLAGALGRPVWLLDRFAPCWRWLRERSDSPWYPSLRLFRQPVAGDWGAVIEEVRTALSYFVSSFKEVEAIPLGADMPDPPDVPTSMQQGVSLLRNDEFEAAIERFDAALSANPVHAPAWDFRGRALGFLGRHAEALESFARVLSIDPQHCAAWVNQGVVLASLNRREEALPCFDKALGIDARHPVLRLNRSLCALSLGRMSEGLEGYEARWECPARFAADLLITPAPLWLGREPLTGKSILLHHEQGYGDTLQFVRYAGEVAARGAHVLLYVPQALCDLMTSLRTHARSPNAPATAGDIEVYSHASAPPRHDFHCPLMSLPLAFATQLQTIPAKIPYLHAHDARVRQWRERLGGRRGLRIGLVWSGRRAPLIAERDIDLRRLAPLLRLDAQFISLQTEVSDSDTAVLHALRLARHGETLQDFADSAALVTNLDLVITVDTAMAHLAGALGKPVWILNRHAACWRWLQDREDSPWYPTARLFRQRRPGDWDAVIGEVIEAVQTVLSHSPSAPDQATAMISARPVKHESRQQAIG